MARAIRLAVRSLMAVALVAAVSWLAHGTHAQRGAIRVAVGEVGASDGDQASAQALSRMLTETLGQQPSLSVTGARRAQLVVRGSVVRWDRRAVEGGTEVRCEVSLVLSEARGGSIRAMLNGRGGARGAGDPARLRDDALRAAVRGALRPLAAGTPALARL